MKSQCIVFACQNFHISPITANGMRHKNVINLLHKVRIGKCMDGIRPFSPSVPVLIFLLGTNSNADKHFVGKVQDRHG